MGFALQTLAEKLAWDLSTEYKFDLVSINPSFMLGPAVSAYGTSNSIMEMKVIASLQRGLCIILSLVRPILIASHEH